MKIVAILGIILFLIGGLVFLIGGFVCFNTWNSDYATAECEKAARDKEKFHEAKQVCGDTTSDCYQRMTIGLTSEADCEHNTEVMNKQMLMGAIPAIVGLLMAATGLLMGIGGFLLARRKKAAATT
jgi:ABC-type antimicrobial peptide transport system permease subunit